MRISMARLLCTFSLLFLFLSTIAADSCEEDEDPPNKSQALKYKIAAFVSILVAGAIGVSLPLLGKIIPSLSPDKSVFFAVKAFAAGVILSTGFIHVLPDAYENLTSPSLCRRPWRDFPFTGLFAMLTAILTLMIDALASSYFKRFHFGSESTAVINHGHGDGVHDHEGHVHVHTHATHGHAHGSASTKDVLLRHRVISQVLELGIIVHSVIIGISLGASQSPKTIRPLVAALTFHQFFEGMGLGGCISQAKFRSRAVVIMCLFFSLTTPLGIAIGIGISDGYDEESPTALIVEGVLNAASAGILIYMALVDLLAADFMNPKLQENFKLQLWVSASLILGAALMALLAIWA